MFTAKPNVACQGLRLAHQTSLESINRVLTGLTGLPSHLLSPAHPGKALMPTVVQNAAAEQITLTSLVYPHVNCLW